MMDTYLSINKGYTNQSYQNLNNRGWMDYNVSDLLVDTNIPISMVS